MKLCRFMILLMGSVTLLSGQSLDPEQIMKSLIQARGEPRDDYPAIKVIERNKNIAAYSTTTNTILLEKKAIEIIRKMGDDAEAALAFLISHELTHFFQHRVWNKLNQDISFFSGKKQMDMIKPLEIEADKYGAFLCYLAGYPYERVAPIAIERLYAAYHLFHKNLPGYPRPDARKQITQSVCDEVDNYKLLFETAQALAHFGAFEWSQSIYDYLLQYLDFQEIYNNSAADKIKWALIQENNILQFPLVYRRSLTLRSTSSLNKDSLINVSIDYLKKGIEKDPRNHDLFINLAIAYSLNNQDDGFKRLVTQLKEVNLTADNLDRLEIIQAIHNINQDTSLAMDIFKEISERSENDFIKEICELNIKKLQGANTSNLFKERTFYYPKLSYIKSHNPSFIIDQSDLLFPKKVTIQKSREGIEMILQNGESTISAFRPASHYDQEQEQETDNVTSWNHFDQKIKFYIKGI